MVSSDNTPLIIAGGGSGATCSSEGNPGLTTENGGDGDGCNGTGGSNGNGGGDAAGCGCGSAGAGGFYTDGSNGSCYGGYGTGFINGGYAGADVSGGSSGGFGGGAGTHSSNTGGGPGGGYSGGGAPYHGDGYSGGGGGSYNSGINQINQEGQNQKWICDNNSNYRRNSTLWMWSRLHWLSCYRIMMILLLKMMVLVFILVVWILKLVIIILRPWKMMVLTFLWFWLCWNLYGGPYILDACDNCYDPTAIIELSASTYSYTGSIDIYEVPANVNALLVEVYGAQGGASCSYSGGYGAMMSGEIEVFPGQELQILVGEQPSLVNNANGGGGGSYGYIR